MGNIFISHVEKDAAIMQQIADGLEAAGYSAWYFERDVLPGTSYLIQITQAIEQCDALVLVVSPNALGSDQVTKEVVGAFERGKPFFPVLIGMTPPEFKEHQPEWRHALGGTAMICISTAGVSACIAHIIDGLKAQGIEPGGSQSIVSPLRPSLSTPASYTPKYLADKILAARSTIEGERKQVTVLFADVTGFTSMSEKMDPEEVHALIAECLDFLTEEIHRYEGTIAQFLGDGVLALFGAPIAHEDAPQRALYAALGIQERLRVYADRLRVKGIEFDMRIGLNTGLVVVGRIGNDLTMEYTAMGDTVNMASRIESIAEPGTIQITDNTYRLTKGYFEFQPLEEVQVKGKEEPVKTYRVLGLGQAKTRLAAGMLRGLTPFVGRKKELEHLKDCYDQAKEGHGQVIGIVGEPGVGKSRLLLELRGTLPQSEYTYLEGQCIHYGGLIAYLPLLNMLRSYFNIKEGEREFVIKKKIEEEICQLDEKLNDIIPPLHEILSLKVEDEDYLKLDPQKKRERTFEAIRNLLIRESQNKPLVITIEDLHWMDKTSEEFLSYLIGSLANAHILLLLLYRPEYTPPWVSKTYYSQIRVDQLSTNTSAEMIQSMLDEGTVVSELKELILSRAAGNPLFMEEFTHTLLDNGSIQKKDHQYLLRTKASDIQVPDTIEGIIAARMDRLEGNLKQTMQVASVIGRDFAYRILQTITGMREELKSYLINLEEMEFIYEKSLFPELEYIFKHALTQEVAYNSLLLKRRKDLHEKIGQAIEELYPARLEEFYEIVAYHYSRSENHDKAYGYLKLSAEKALNRYSHWEAFIHCGDAITILKKLPDTVENIRRGIEIRLLMVSRVLYSGISEDHLRLVQEGERLSKKIGDERSLAKFYSLIGLYYGFLGDHNRGITYAESAFQSAEKAQDDELIAQIGLGLCGIHFNSSEYSKIVDVAPKAIAAIERMSAPEEMESLTKVNLYSMLCGIYGVGMAFIGNFTEGEALCEKAIRFALEIDDFLALGNIESYYGTVFIVKGDGQNAAHHYKNSVKYGEQTQNMAVLVVSKLMLEWAHYLLGDTEIARQNVNEYLMSIPDIQNPSFVTLHYLLSVIYLDLGDFDNARSWAEQTLKMSQEHGLKTWEGMAWCMLGLILGKTDMSQWQQAEEHLLQGIQIADDLGVKPIYSLGYLYLGEFYTDTGQKEKALETLKKAEGMFQEMGMDYYLRRTQQVLERVEASKE